MLRLIRLPSLATLLLVQLTAQAQRAPVSYVNTLIGSAPSRTPTALRHSEAGSELKGQTVPMVGRPHAMTNWTPQTQATEIKCIPPYYYNDPRINGFRGSHWMNGSCVQDYGSVTLMPLAGPLRVRPNARGSAYSHQQEVATPAYYRTTLTDYAIQAELTGHTRAGLLQFTFGRGGSSHMLIEANSDEGQGFLAIDSARQEVTGYNPVHRIYQGAGQPAGFSGYFVVQFDTPFTVSGTWQDTTITPGRRSVRGQGRREATGAYVSWQLRPGQVVRVRVGTSFVSLDGARQNLRAEIPDFDLARQRRQTEAAWNQELSKLTVDGRESDKALFYSALYRTRLTPRIFSDVDGRYPGFADDTTTHRADGFTYYCDYNLWDTFRGVHPLLNLVDPARSGDMMQSLVKKAEQGGWMPIFPCWNTYTAAMVGDHALSVMADAYVKGVRNFDIPTAYRYLRKNAFTVNTDARSYANGQGRRALASYLTHRYIPLEDSVWQAFHKREQVSRTLEYAYDDFCLSQLATALGHTDDARQLRERAQWYRNVLDPSTRYVRGRYTDGRWMAPFDPFALRASFITEGSPAQYTFFVPQDMPGLISAVGGPVAFVAKLDTLFNGGHYWHGNEPNNQIAYLYALAGSPHKTQARVRQLIYDEYDGSPGGLSGNEDGGQMSAWLVFSMAGLYPVCPGTPDYVLGSPVFDRITIQSPGGRPFRIETRFNSPQHVYVQSATLNGEPVDGQTLTHQTIRQGGTLVLTMGNRPAAGYETPKK